MNQHLSQRWQSSLDRTKNIPRRQYQWKQYWQTSALSTVSVTVGLSHQKADVQVYNATALVTQYIVNAGVVNTLKLKSPPGYIYQGQSPGKDNIRDVRKHQDETYNAHRPGETKKLIGLLTIVDQVFVPYPTILMSWWVAFENVPPREDPTAIMPAFIWTSDWSRSRSVRSTDHKSTGNKFRGCSGQLHTRPNGNTLA